MGVSGSSKGVNRMGREASHSPPSSTEVKNEWTHTCTPPIRLRGTDRDTFFGHRFRAKCIWPSYKLSSEGSVYRK